MAEGRYHPCGVRWAIRFGVGVLIGGATVAHLQKGPGQVLAGWNGLGVQDTMNGSGALITFSLQAKWHDIVSFSLLA